MQNPLSPEEFFNIFREYNEGIYPIQWVLASICALAAFFAFFVGGLSTRYVAALLSVASIWNGVAYFWAFYTPANGIGWLFGGLFVAQAVALGVYAFRAKGEVWFGPTIWSWIGAILALYAVGFYPLIGILFGHAYPDMPVLGAAPCPTTILMIGFLLAASPAVPRWLLTIPIVWSLFGAAAISYGVVEDLGLSVAGLCAVAFVLRHVQIRFPGTSGHRPAAAK